MKLLQNNLRLGGVAAIVAAVLGWELELPELAARSIR